MEYWVYEMPLWVNMMVFALVLLVPMEIGFRVGLRDRRARPDVERESADVTLSSMLTLLALMLAFTYAYCVSRADMRKRARTQEVNAIGTAFLRADLAPEPGRTELRRRLLEYARTRLVTAEMVHNRQQFDEIVARSVEAQSRIWPATKSVVEQEAGMPEPLKASLVQSVNDVLDAHTVIVAAVYDRLPAAVLALLLLIAAVSIGWSARNAGTSGVRGRGRTAALAVTLAALIFLILDFDIVLRGFVQLNQDSLETLIRDMESSL